MAAVFLKLLNLSISASWLVLAVLALRLVLRCAPKWVNVLLWGMVALRLMLPFSIESALSLIPSAETLSPEVVRFDPAPTITSGVSIIDNAVNPSLSEHFSAVPTASVNPLYVWTEIAGWVWLIGLGAMLLYALVSYLRLRRRVSVSLAIQDHIYLCDAISSPFILGVVKPRIYLPSTLDEIQQQNVLAHEHAHLARHDHWWKPLGFALLAVYWFNPVLWLAYALLCRDIELACDERVIRTMDESAVKTYSTVLLACSMPRKAVITCPLAFGEVGVKERVRNALHYKKPAFWVVAASVTVCVVVAVCFLTNPPRALSKVCGDFWDTEAVCTYTEEQPDADAHYTTANGTVRLSEHLALVRIGAARPEKKTAVNPKWSSLYLALPSADGAPAERLTIDFIREYDAPGGTKATYTLNIGTRDASKSYKILSGQDEIEEFLAYLRGDATEEETKNLTDPKLGRRLTVPVKWDELAVLAVGGKGIMPPDGDPNAEDYIPLFRLYEKRAYESAPQDEQGYVWNLCAMRTDRFERTYGADAVFSEILGIADYVIGSDDEYVYLLTLPSDVRWLENDPVSYRQYKALQSDSQGVLTRFLKDNGIHINEVCPASSVFSPPARGDAASMTGYAAYDALLAEISDLRRSGASDVQTDFSHDLLSANDYYQTPGWLLRNLDGDGIPELLLGADWGDGHTVIFNIYCLDGAKAVRVVDGWSRSRWYLCTDGSLAHEGSDGASEGTYSYYRYENGAMRHLETLISLDGWFYSDTTDHYLGGDGFRAISEDDAAAVMNKYTYEPLPFTPFVT